MFLERGYDAVTVAEVAREAGVSSVTVFNHFPRKEDLFLDRSDEAIELVLTAVRERGEGVDALTALRALAFRLLDERHPFSGLDERSLPFFRTVAQSPALLARAREIAAQLQAALALELAGETDGELLAAFFVAGYTTVLVGTGRRVIAGESPGDLLADHRARLDALFDALENGLATPSA
jgi:AcrR family transcriptional regulator